MQNWDPNTAKLVKNQIHIQIVLHYVIEKSPKIHCNIELKSTHLQEERHSFLSQKTVVTGRIVQEELTFLGTEILIRNKARFHNHCQIYSWHQCYDLLCIYYSLWRPGENQDTLSIPPAYLAIAASPVSLRGLLAENVLMILYRRRLQP